MILQELGQNGLESQKQLAGILIDFILGIVEFDFNLKIFLRLKKTLFELSNILQCVVFLITTN